MKITDTLYSEVEALWEKAAEKEILIKMADGSLDENRYSRYMLQDYYYLLEYKDILERLLKLSDDSEVSEFLKNYTDVDLRDRVYYYLNLMKKDINLAEYIICGQPTIVDYFYSDFDEEYIEAMNF